MAHEVPDDERDNKAELTVDNGRPAPADREGQAIECADCDYHKSTPEPVDLDAHDCPRCGGRLRHATGDSDAGA